MPRPAILAALAVLLAACGSTRPFRGEEGSPRAVIFCPAELREKAQAMARTLHDEDYDVTLKVTPIVRSRSSMAVYGLHDAPDRLDDLTHFAEGLGEDVEILPFQQHATGGNAVVIWLASRD